MDCKVAKDPGPSSDLCGFLRVLCRETLGDPYTSVTGGTVVGA